MIRAARRASLFELDAVRGEQLFANFIHGRRQRPAWLAARAAAGATASAVLFGARGSGKSHLLAAARAAARNSDVALLELGSADFGAANGLLVLDDLAELDGHAQRDLFRFLNHMAQQEQARLHLLAAAQVAPAELALRADVRTRLQALPAFALHPLDDRQLVRALGAHATRLGRKLSPAVARLLVRTQPRSLATLTELLERLDAHAIAENRALTAAAARRWLEGDELAR